MSEDPNPTATEGSESSAASPLPAGVYRLVTVVTSRRETGVLFGFFVLFGLIAVTRPDIFFDFDSMSRVTARLFRRSTSHIIIGVGMTYLIIGGEFDLSVGSMFAVGGILFAFLMENYALGAVAALAVVLVVGGVVGATNGVIVTKIGVPSLIATIGMLSVLRGIAFWLTPGGSRSVPEEGFVVQLFGGSGNVLGVEIANQVFWAIGLLIVFGLLLQKTKFGYHVYAVGDDPDAANKTGIDTDRVKLVNFVLTAMLAAFAGIVSISFFGSMFGTAGAGFELLVIAAVIIGGTNLFGGEGTLTGMFIGALVISVIPVLLVLNGFNVEIQELLTGIVIIVAVVLDIIFRQR